MYANSKLCPHWRGSGVLAGEVLEQAVLLSVRLQDEAAFERNFLQLKTYYTDSRCAAPAVCSQAQFKECTAPASVSCCAATRKRLLAWQVTSARFQGGGVDDGAESDAAACPEPHR